MDFNGDAKDKSHYRHPTHVDKVLLGKNNTGYFNGGAHVRIDSFPTEELRDNMVVNVRFYVQPKDRIPHEVAWGDLTGKWGLKVVIVSYFF